MPLAANLLQERRTDACGTCSDFKRLVASGAGEIAATMDQVVTVAFGDGGTGGLGDMPEEPDAIDEEELVRRCQAAPNPGRFPASPSGSGSPHPLAAPVPSAPPRLGPTLVRPFRLTFACEGVPEASPFERRCRRRAGYPSPVSDGSVPGQCGGDLRGAEGLQQIRRRQRRRSRRW